MRDLDRQRMARMAGEWTVWVFVSVFWLYLHTGLSTSDFAVTSTQNHGLMGFGYEVQQGLQEFVVASQVSNIVPNY